jgi:hypothetical protein
VDPLLCDVTDLASRIETHLRGQAAPRSQAA